MFTLSCYLNAVYNMPFLSACTLLFGWMLFLLCSTSLCTNTKMQQPSHLHLRTELHSRHAPPTHFLALLLFTHESLSFFLLTNVRVSQKCLHLLSLIIHSISSTNYQYISALGHNPLAHLVDDSHLTPHIPIFQLHLCLCPISIRFNWS